MKGNNMKKFFIGSLVAAVVAMAGVAVVNLNSEAVEVSPVRTWASAGVRTWA
jgi:tetrahydrodipicolinate N-succinyltransferase